MTGLAIITAMCALWICAWCVQTDNYGLAFVNALSCVASAYNAYLFWQRDRRKKR